MFRKSRYFFLRIFCVLGTSIFGASQSRAEFSEAASTPFLPTEFFAPQISSELPPSLLHSLKKTIDFINQDSRALVREKKLQTEKCFIRASESSIVLPVFPGEWASWMQERIKIIFFEDENLSTQLHSLASADAYPYFSETSKRMEDLGVLPPIPQLGSRMLTHVASEFYLKAKLTSQVLTLESSDFGSLPLSSPRAGWVLVYRDLFSSRRAVNFANPDAESNLISRAAVFFHEARHSDGHGKYLGFMHVPCPQGHEAEGIVACDDVANGAFRAGAEYLQRKIAHCRSCRESEKQALGILLLDQLNRQTRIDDFKAVDAAPEFLELKK